jgi:cation:H+ antiporter
MSSLRVNCSWCPIVDFVWLMVGLAALWLGTELTLRGAISVAERWGVPEFVVGAAILSVGSDLPELSIAILGAVEILQNGQISDVVIGSAVGSALGQIGFVAGVTGLFGYLTLPKPIIHRHGSIMLGSLLILVLVGLDGDVTRVEGGLLLVVYVIYFTLLMTDKSELSEATPKLSMVTTMISWLYLGGGLTIVGIGAGLTLESATRIAETMAISQSFIAIVVIGLGTSLPELSISLGAVLKKRPQLSVGNLIGSNIFDTLVPVGVAAVIATLKFERSMLRLDVPFLFVLSALALIFFAKTRGLQKHEAAILLALYCGYVLVKLALI